MFRIFGASLVSVAVLMGCTSASATPSPSVSPDVATPSAEPSFTSSSGASHAVTSVPPATPASTVAPPIASGALPVRGPGKEIGSGVLMAAGHDGSLYALVPKPDKGAVLARLDRSGRSTPGWPIAIDEDTTCGLVLPVDDGTVRLLCYVFDSSESLVRAMAFDAQGRPLPGWPVAAGPGSWYAGRVVGNDLAFYWRSPTAGFGMTVIASNGSTRRGTVVPGDESWMGSAAVAPDGIVYAVEDASAQTAESPVGGSPEVSRITGSDLAGVRAGWPVETDGIASGPAFGPDGRIVLTIGSRVGTTTRVAIFERRGDLIARSATIPIKTAESGVDCVAYVPRVPLIAPDGTVFVWSDLDSRVFALDPNLRVLPGWPYRPANWLVAPGWDDPRAELNCSQPAAPSVGPNGTIYLPLRPRDETVGGTLIAVDLNGRVHAGWPVTLQVTGAEFLWTVVGTDGTVYALAKEPEARDSASVTILAIAPDSTVLYRTTIIEP